SHPPAPDSKLKATAAIQLEYASASPLWIHIGTHLATATFRRSNERQCKPLPRHHRLTESLLLAAQQEGAAPAPFASARSRGPRELVGPAAKRFPLQLRRGLRALRGGSAFNHVDCMAAVTAAQLHVRGRGVQVHLRAGAPQ
uniref:ANK_REP_REGION domain-containing protein n=1 Tax=Macrostomum lignano TaxID=282301 RepID=A0A1I8FJH8_9PLAT